MNKKIIASKEDWTANAWMADYGILEISGQGLTLKPKQDDTYTTQSTLITKAIDSSNNGTIWYRVLVEADVPACTKAEVTYAISQGEVTPQEISHLTWSDSPIECPTDSLIVGPRGRYLWLKITLTTSGIAKTNHQAPIVKSVRLYYTPPTYINYLPALYQEDSTSKDFLVNYLSVFEAVLAEPRKPHP